MTWEVRAYSDYAGPRISLLWDQPSYLDGKVVGVSYVGCSLWRDRS